MAVLLCCISNRHKQPSKATSVFPDLNPFAVLVNDDRMFFRLNAQFWLKATET